MFQTNFGDFIKVTGINTMAFVVSLTDIEKAIRLAGLLAALVYTCLKIIDWFLDKRRHRSGIAEKENV